MRERYACARLMEAAEIKSEDRSLDREHLIADFLHLQQKLGRRPLVTDFIQYCHTPKVLDRVFGKRGWKRLIKVIGREALPKRIQGCITAEHLIADYLDTEKTLGRKPGFTHFHALQRHSPKVLVRVFGNPGWTNLRKTAEKAKQDTITLQQGLSTNQRSGFRPEEKTARSEAAVLREIRSVYRRLLSKNRVLRKKTVSSAALRQAWNLRRRLNDLFHEVGRAISMEEALQHANAPRKSR